jgi:histone-lysine N-methyltransferase SETMAR
MELQVDKNEHLRHLLLAEFNRGSKAAQAARNICEIYGDGFIPERTAQFWFARFKEGNFSLNDAPRSGRPIEIDDEELEAILQEDRHQTTRELAEQLNCSPQTVLNHLNKMGKTQKFGCWVPRKLTQDQKNQRVTVCASLLARHRRAQQQHRPFLRLIVTGDEKWCLYVNVKRRPEWVNQGEQASPVAKADLHPKKDMLCVWWDVEGLIHSELLPRNRTITAEVYFCLYSFDINHFLGV